MENNVYQICESYRQKKNIADDKDDEVKKISEWVNINGEEYDQRKLDKHQSQAPGNTSHIVKISKTLPLQTKVRIHA